MVEFEDATQQSQLLINEMAASGLEVGRMAQVLQLVENAQAELADELEDRPQRAWVVAERLGEAAEVRRGGLALPHGGIVLHFRQH